MPILPYPIESSTIIDEIIILTAKFMYKGNSGSKINNEEIAPHKLPEIRLERVIFLWRIQQVPDIRKYVM